MGASEEEEIVVASVVEEVEEIVVEEVVAEVSHLLLSIILEFKFFDPDYHYHTPYMIRESLTNAAQVVSVIAVAEVEREEAVEHLEEDLEVDEEALVEGEAVRRV